MDERFVDLRSTKNPKARIKMLSGHFATKNSHVNTYIDMSTVKTRHNNARETARTLAEEYLTNTMVDTIVCLKNTEVIGAFMAETLADSSNMSMSAGNNISVVTPEFDFTGQILFRENSQRMIEGKQVLILTDSMATGTLTMQAIESVLYYRGIQRDLKSSGSRSKDDLHQLRSPGLPCIQRTSVSHLRCGSAAGRDREQFWVCEIVKKGSDPLHKLYCEIKKVKKRDIRLTVRMSLFYSFLSNKKQIKQCR